MTAPNSSLLLILKAAGQFVPYVNIAETLIEEGFAFGHQMQHFAAEQGITLQEWADARSENKVSVDDEIVKLGGTIPGSAPAPPTPTLDPTSVEYATLDEAKAAMTAADPIIIQKANGKFVVWPNLGPFPGTKVWPEN